MPTQEGLLKLIFVFVRKPFEHKRKLKRSGAKPICSWEIKLIGLLYLERELLGGVIGAPGLKTEFERSRDDGNIS